MHIYFGKALTGTVRPPPEFASRDIKLLKSDVTSSQYTGIPYIYSSLHAAYVYFVGFFMTATVQRKKVYTARSFVGNYFGIKMDKLLPWGFPDVVVGALPGHDAEFNALAQEVGGVIVSGRGTKTMSIPHVGIESYKKIRAADVQEDVACDQGRSNLEDFRGFLHVLRIFTGFLMTHQYPNEHDASVSNPHKRTKLEMTLHARGEDDDMEDIEGAPVEEEVKALHFELIRVAKPSISGFPYHGTANDVPHHPGLLFPYFHGCIAVSFTEVSTLIKDYFLSCLGEDINECCETLRSIKKASSSWAMSPAGIELQHLAAGIRLAITTGARLFVIREENIYLGFALLGFGFKVVTATGIVSAMCADDLQAAIAKLESRSQAARSLVQMIGDYARDEGWSEEDLEDLPNAETCGKSLRPLRRWILENNNILDADDGNARTEIIKAMRKCFQSTPFARVNVETIGRAILQILDGLPIDSALPFFISDQVFTDTSRIHEVLAAFGATAFSFIHANGTEYHIPAEGEEDSASQLVTIPGGKGKTRSEMAMPAIFVALKPMRSCVGDFNDMMAKRRVVMKSERAGAQKNIRFFGQDRDDLWTTLKECCANIDKAARDKASKAMEKGKAAEVFNKSVKRKFRDDFA